MTPYTPHIGDYQESLGPVAVAGINGVNGGRVAGINWGEFGLSDIGYWVGVVGIS